jgi:hypothetical protein
VLQRRTLLRGGGRQFACSDQSQGGPSCGASLSLMKRLMFSQVSVGGSVLWRPGSSEHRSQAAYDQDKARVRLVIKESCNSLESPP